MITTQTIEQRVTHLEAELEPISRLVKPEQPATEPNWIDRLAGSITNETLFLEALEYGKQHRQDS
jgi:hypothetical protein